MRILATVCLLLSLTLPTMAQEPSPTPAWNVKLSAGRSVPSNIEVVNRCRKKHSFELVPSNVPFLQIEQTQAEVKGGKVVVVPVRFDTHGMQPGTYTGQVDVVCLTCAKERRCRQDRDTLPVVLTVPGSDPPAQAADSESTARTATPAAAVEGDPCATVREACNAEREAAAEKRALSHAAQREADRQRQAFDEANDAAAKAEKAAEQAAEAAKDDPSDYRARVNEQEYSSADVAYLEVLRAENLAAYNAGTIDADEYQRRAKELTAKKAREERLANKERLKKEAEKAKQAAAEARAAADQAKQSADAAQQKADAAHRAADAARAALDACEKKAAERCRQHRLAEQQADKEARQAAEAERQAQAAADKKRVDEENARQAAARDAKERREQNEYLIDNIRELGLIDSRAMAQVPSIWQWLPDIIETPVATLLEQQTGTPIPTDTLKALGGLYGIIGKLLDPCTALGKRKTVERLQEMTNSKTGRKYTLKEALAKTDQMCKLLRELQAKLRAMEKASQAKK